ncbi:CaiB/BaiF CoA transferase family protein [Candidatus Poriferisodalis sp.]|uniref:CaiB/BaiF CoA transferase family protein n=1 Tax=Candidatus Poriferisodalis sp. TaxID=3101277 RepID=UPI003B594186
MSAETNTVLHGVLADYRVIDLTDERGHLAGAIWVQMGADVIAIEPPEGSSARRLGPFAGDVEHPERSLHHWAYNRGKRSVVLDLRTPQDVDRAKALIAGADVVFESFEPGEAEALGLGREALAGLNPALIHVSITAFGSDGPKANWAVSDLALQASAVNMAITGDKDRAPLRAGGTLPQAMHNAASEGAGAALIALWDRQTRSGLGQHVDMSAQQSMSQASMSSTLNTSLNATVTKRIAGGASLQGIDIQLMWPCADGHASVTFLFGPGFRAFTENLMDWVYEEGFCDEATRDKNWNEYAMMLLDGREPISEYERLKQVLTEFFATKTKAQLLEAAMTRRVLITPVSTTAEVVDSHQLAFREYWEDVDHSDVVSDVGADSFDSAAVRYPGAFAKFTETPLLNLRRPPKLGEHTVEVLAELDEAAGAARAPAVPASVRGVADAASITSPPLEGVKVLDFMWAMAGPAASRVLADYGADVIRVESANKLDAVRSIQPFHNDVGDPDGSGLFSNLNAGKRGLALDMSKPQALDVIWDLIDWADVILESFSPKAMAGWGMGWSQVHQRRPDVIMASSCLMGQTGPLAMLAGFGTMAAAVSGFFYPVGWPDRAPAGPFTAYTDYTSPRWLVAAVMGALEHRRQTGRGQYVDLSQSEAALHLMAPALLERTTNGRIWEAADNRDLVFAPQGAYQTASGGPAGDDHDDNWIAVSCVDDGQWAALAGAIGRSDLASLNTAERHARHDELDDIISAWTRGRDGYDLMTELQAAGVAAHIVQNSPEFTVDPQVVHRQHLVEVPHGKQGTTTVENTRFVLSRTPAQVSYGGPTLGEHSFEILTETLAYDGDRIAELAVAELLE